MPKVLVIDPDELFRSFLAALLTRAGYAVVVRPNGARIEELVASGEFAAVVTDLYMPDADGIEILTRLKRVMPDIPVIGMTGSVLGTEDPCSRAMKLFGAVDVVPKPIDRDRLLAALMQAVDGESGTAGSC